MIDDNQIYVVVDIETDGPVAGLYSMLSIAAVATTATEEIGSFYRTLQPLDGASQEPSTMAWWKTQPTAWQEVTRNTEPAGTVIKAFYEWVMSLNLPAWMKAGMPEHSHNALDDARGYGVIVRNILAKQA